MKDKQPPRFGRSDEPTLGARRPSGKKPSRPTGNAKGSRQHGPRDKTDDRERPENRGKPSNRGRLDHRGERTGPQQQRGKRPPSANGNRPLRSRASRPDSGKGAEATSGLTARYLSLTILEAVIRDRTSLDMAIPAAFADERFEHLEPRDKAFARLLAMTVLRHHGSLQKVIDTFLDKPLAANADRIRIILLAGAAELLLLEVAPHAAISTAVELTRLSTRTQHFDRLANAILRRISETGAEVFATNAAPAANFPDWMIADWSNAYGADTATRIAEASLHEAALDITPKDQPLEWAARLDVIVLPTGTLRRAAGGRIEELDGYHEGGWWVQDAAAALPAKLLNVAAGQRVLDLCAAPGGKTAQLCAAGADVTAIDVSETRMQRLRANLSRLGLAATIISADATTWRTIDPFDAVLVDAPCTATGTIRRHPDILHLKRSGDTTRLAEMQLRLLRNAAGLVAVGGTVLYCTCSLEPVECEHVVEAFLAAPGAVRRRFERSAITASEIGNQADWITPTGDLRTFPFHLPHENPALAGIDGFYAARLVRRA